MNVQNNSDANDHDEGMEVLEEVLILSQSSFADAMFDDATTFLEEIIFSRDFEEYRDKLLMANCELFEDSDENKLVYTELFNEYVNSIETYLTDKLSNSLPRFDFSKFYEWLMANKNAVKGDLVDEIYSLTDFMIFKENVLEFKKALNNETHEQLPNFDDSFIVKSIKFN